MTETATGFGQDGVISASWERCAQRHKLVRDAARPILRLQSSEVAPRLEELVERTGGRQGVFRQLAEIAATAGHCFVVTDADGVLVRLETTDTGRANFEANGIAVGSCWDERIAGTNGVAMAMSEGRPFTVRGKDHYFAKLRLFSCSSVPLQDADHHIVGTVNLSMLDTGRVSDYVFAEQLLRAAADRIHRILFERRFGENRIVSVSMPGHGDLLSGSELIAVDEAGLILGATTRAHQLVGLSDPPALMGQAFDAVFGADAATLDRVPDRLLSTRANAGTMLTLSARPMAARAPAKPQALRGPTPARKPLRRRLAPSYRDLAIGSEAMASACARADAYFSQGLPFVIEGVSGTGKSALVSAILRAADLPPEQVVTIDCALLGEAPDDRADMRKLFEQACVMGALGGATRRVSALVFDNIDEMPTPIQAGLRNLLDRFDTDGTPTNTGLHVLATSRQPLLSVVQDGRFREDLYYLLANTLVTLPPLGQRDHPEALAQVLANRLSGSEIRLSDEARAAIAAYGWPGNVRELRSVLQQALMEGDGARISLVDLRAAPAFARGTACALGGATLRKPAQAAVRYDEQAMVLDALIGARWNVTQAARVLGMGRATIHRKMKQFGITRPD